MSLYLKYRPTEFDAVKGNADIISSLSTLLADKKKCPHSFLLTGPTGCGKTTIGRIIADMLGCKGSDFNEIDSGQFRGIDSIREVRKNSVYMPMEGTCRVWLFDEVHKWTNDAQNAALKQLEDAPAHVYFILCTTDPQKLIDPVKKRCQHYQVQQLSDVQMKGLLRSIVHGEGEKLEQEIYDQIIKDGEGHPRNAINILEQVLSVPKERRLEVAKQSAVLQSQSIDLCRILIKPFKWIQIAPILVGLKDQEGESVRRVVMGYCQSILLKTENDQAAMVLEEFIEPFYNSGFPSLVLACYRVMLNRRQ